MIPPIVGVPFLCLCSLTIGLSEIFAWLRILLTYQVKSTVAKNVIKKRINKSLLIILPHIQPFKLINNLFLILYNVNYKL